MRACIPTLGNKGLDEQIGEHFGYAPTFTIVDLETEKVEVIPNTSHHMGGSGYPPELMQKKGVNIVLCSNLGRRAVGMFEEFGIEVYIGAKGTVRDAIRMWKDNMLQMATDKNACEQHAFRKRR
ncbi:MAG: dinitrogenase iron-molybdenum cofactor biosynthesis protein [Candidatus Altiarchaeales archaeon]|nr:MAG: dinitrogenase iron-molybdenum cofactor biosynthesis protein [Candidatus Altiarchaeales archaeon]